MVFPTSLLPVSKDIKSDAQKKCEAQGGTWDGTKCTLPTSNKDDLTKKSTNNPLNLPQINEKDILKPKIAEQPRIAPTVNPNVVQPTKSGTNYISPLTRDYISKEQFEIEKRQLNLGALTLEEQKTVDYNESLSSQVGEFSQTAIDPTGLDVGEAISSSLTGAIPDAIRLAGAGFVAGGIAGVGVGSTVTAPAGAIIGGATGFIAGVTRGIQSNFADQRRDTTTAQQRVLDEGKQTMKDWATMAEADPSNKAKYLSEYNKVSQQIDQAYRQMKLDTSKDVAKYETALPNLAEFEAFYASGGERDVLDIDMRNALVTPSSIDYKMLELASKYSK